MSDATNTGTGLPIDLRGRLAVVTGAGKGIGRSICLEMARAGADIFAVSRTAADLASLGDEVRALGTAGGYHACTLELTGAASAERLAAAVAEVGAADVLVNNAGISITAPAAEVTEADWDAVFNTNIRGAFFCAQALGRGMCARGHGRIINVGSQAGLVALTEHATYGATKAALHLLTKVLAVEWGPRGVTVNAIAPTVILTPMGERVWGAPEKGGPMLARIPVGRFGRPAEVAALVAFLASDLAGLINGEVIAIDGGYTAQ